MRYFLVMALGLSVAVAAAGETTTIDPPKDNRAGYTPANWREFYELDNVDNAVRRLAVPKFANNGDQIGAEQSQSPVTPPVPSAPVAEKPAAVEMNKDFFDTKIAPLPGAPVAEKIPASVPTDDQQPRTRTIILPTPQSVNYDSYYGDDPAFTPREAAQIAISDGWANGGNGAPMNVQGAVVFAFGLQQPSLICAVFQVTDIELQAGEVIQSVIVGDSLRWGIDAMISGGTTPHIVVKPMDSGLTTSMVVATDRRTYHFAMKSSRRNYMSRVLFTYPQEVAEKFEQQRKDAAAKAQAERERATIPETNEYLGDLNFNYRVTGKAIWKPTRVFNDGRKTIIEMPRVLGGDERPALLIKQNGEETLVNYRVQGDRYIVDALFNEAILIAGVGRRQQKITVQFLDYGKSYEKRGAQR